MKKIKGVCMGMDGISSVNSNMMYAVNAVHFGHNNLSEELIKKLKQLGIDPSTVKSEAEARALIAQAEKQQATNQPTRTQQAQVQPQIESPNVDLKKLNDDIKKMGDKLGIDVTTIKSPKDIVDRFDVTIKEFTAAASAQSNKNAMASVDNNTKGVKISTGAEIVDKPEVVQADFKSIKDRVEELENAKNAMFAGQDMLAIMNRIKLGI